MIQRIQSVWFFLAAITMGCLLFVPMATSNFNGTDYFILAGGLYKKTNGTASQMVAYTPLFICNIAFCLICIINIFNFKKRGVQKIIALISIVLIIGMSFIASRYAQNIPGTLENANYAVGMFLPPVAIIFIILAIRGINNDEKLIKSADRLR